MTWYSKNLGEERGNYRKWPDLGAKVRPKFEARTRTQTRSWRGLERAKGGPTREREGGSVVLTSPRQ